MIGQEWKMRGNVVLVDAGLSYDPLDKQNQIGVISEANLEYDDIYVDFVDKVGLYPSDVLYTFIDQDDILQNLRKLPPDTDPETFKALCKIEAFLGYHDVNWQQKAMLIARDHPEIQPLCIETLNTQIVRNHHQHYGL